MPPEARQGAGVVYNVREIRKRESGEGLAPWMAEVLRVHHDY